MPRSAPTTSGGAKSWPSPGRNRSQAEDSGKLGFRPPDRLLVQIPGVDGLFTSLPRHAGAQAPLGLVERTFGIHPGVVRLIIGFFHFSHEFSGIGTDRRLLGVNFSQTAFGGIKFLVGCP